MGWRLGVAFAAILLLLGCDGGPDPDPLPPVGTEVGRLAPALGGALDQSPFELEAVRDSATVVVFYRGAYCGLCRERLRSLEEYHDAYGAAGARVVAASLDPPAEVGRTSRTLGLGFSVVSVDSATFMRWGVLSDEGVPMPASFLLDDRNVIRFRHVGQNAADRASDIGLLAALRQMRDGGTAR